MWVYTLPALFLSIANYSNFLLATFIAILAIRCEVKFIKRQR